MSNDAPSLRESAVLAAKLAAHREALFMCAAHCQGGHSAAGVAVAETLDVPFPIRMPDLIKAARAEGRNPATLWPWLIAAHQGRNQFFTSAEIESARKGGASPISSPPQGDGR